LPAGNAGILPGSRHAALALKILASILALFFRNIRQHAFKHQRSGHRRFQEESRQLRDDLDAQFPLQTTGILADRIGRKPTFLLFQAGAVIMVLIYANLTDQSLMLWAGAALGMLAATHVLDMLATLFLIPELKGTELE
jgi:hypothetical protein